MDLISLEKRWKIAASILWAGLYLLIRYNPIENEDLLQHIFTASVGALFIPLALLTIYAIKSIKTTIQTNYSNFKNQKNTEIKVIRSKQNKETDLKKKIEYEEEILEIMNQMISFSSNRVTKNLLLSFFAIIGAIFASLFNVSRLIGIDSQWAINFTILYIGLYYSSKALLDVLLGVNK